MPKQAIDYHSAFADSRVGQSLGEEVSRDLLLRGEMRHWSKGELIFQEDDEVPGLWLVVDGQVKLSRFTADGREVILHMASPFMIIAEAAIFLGKYPASATATSDCAMVLLRTPMVFELMESHPKFMRRIFGSMSVWLKRMVDKVDQLTMNDATARLVRYLLDLKGEKGSTKDRVVLPVKKGELAVMLNMNQATLSRSLRRLQDEGAIAVDAKYVDLLNHPKLQKLALPPIE
ncbi:Crp/Fnr family transcriptional regulator [bacterium]|nr:Crp/Fnr family transcriptional regulator [bacterium]